MIIATRALSTSLRAGVVAAILSLAALPAAAASDPRTYDLASQDLGQALKAVALKSGHDVVAPSRLLEGRRSPPLKGQFSAEEAVTALLRGSGLEVEAVGDALVVREPGGQAGGERTLAGGQAPPPQEVTVTGSRIRGAPPTAPVITLGRTEIDESGYADIGDVLRSLPESFQGGQNPGVMGGASAAGIANQNITNASTINLRGLGSDATLVLLNGHRLTGDSAFQAPDISGIPLSAIDRIEIVTDGASALYGSDAVAGVANIILKKTFDGLDVSARLGGTMDGGGFDQIYSALGGGGWGSGHALVSLEYEHQEPIKADERSFAAGATPGTPLLDNQIRRSLLFSGGQDVTDQISGFLDALYYDRSAIGYQDYTAGGTPYTERTYSPTFSITGGVKFKLPDGWEGSLTGGAAEDRNDQFTLSPISVSHIDYENQIEYGEINADGHLPTLPTGPWHLAVGGGYRAESYDVENYGSSPEQTGSRDVVYGYGETLVPLFNPAWGHPGLYNLDLNVAGRVERYSDFGTTANPKVGVRWTPLQGLDVRTTWGTSFKAPSFEQLTQSHIAYLFTAAELGSTSPGAAILDYGGNPNLKPERSTSWTGGLQYQPPIHPSLKFDVTYFDIDYTDRIVQPFASPFTGLSNPLYGAFIETNPSAADINQVVSTANFYNYTTGPLTPSSVIAILRDRYYNAEAQVVRGVDLTLSDHLTLPLGRLEGSANATWERLTQRTIASGPDAVLSGTLFNPPKARVRTTLTWRCGGFAATGAINYVSGEIDNAVAPVQHIASWTTGDVNLDYAIPQSMPGLGGFEVTLSATNLLDKDPPYAKGAGVSYSGILYDSTNTSAVGRFVALTLRRHW